MPCSDNDSHTKNNKYNKKIDPVLSQLERDTDNYISGQQLAQKAGISRSAIWKYIRRLRRYGYQIEALHGVGYRLLCMTDSPVPWELSRLIQTSFIAKNIIYREVIDSTQTLAIKLVSQTEDSHGTIVIAEQQKNGRGRLRRKWLSPKGGLWLSVILKPAIPMSKTTLLPFAAALAVCHAIRQTTKLDAKLKWPNDVMISGKKVAGILVDIGAEAERVNYVVIGIGINVNVDASLISSNLDGQVKLTSIRSELGCNASRLILTKTLLENLELYYLELESQKYRKIIDNWKQVSDMIGKQVQVYQGNNNNLIQGIAVNIDDNDGALILRTDNGNDISIVSGDIRVRY
jgi:BirA family biotin operon repressor/biotin-[acetyl-CoA-carboxylase] ligase